MSANSAANLSTPVNLEAYEPKIDDKSSEGPSVSAATLGSMAEGAQIKSNIVGQKKVVPNKKVNKNHKKIMNFLNKNFLILGRFGR